MCTCRGRVYVYFVLSFGFGGRFVRHRSVIRYCTWMNISLDLVSRSFQLIRDQTNSPNTPALLSLVSFFLFHSMHACETLWMTFGAGCEQCVPREKINFSGFSRVFLGYSIVCCAMRWEAYILYSQHCLSVTEWKKWEDGNANVSENVQANSEWIEWVAIVCAVSLYALGTPALSSWCHQKQQHRQQPVSRKTPISVNYIVCYIYNLSVRTFPFIFIQVSQRTTKPNDSTLLKNIIESCAFPSYFVYLSISLVSLTDGSWWIAFREQQPFREIYIASPLERY